MRKEVAERWRVSFMVVVGSENFEQQAGRKGSSCRMVGRANQQETRAALVAAWREGWIGFGRWRACG